MSPSIRYLNNPDRVRAIFTYPAFYLLGSALYHERDVGRPSIHHPYELLLFAALARATRSMVRAESDLRDPTTWGYVRDLMLSTIEHHHLDVPPPAPTPPSCHHWARYRDRHLGTDEGIAALRREHLTLAVALAHSIGLLDARGPGSFTHPGRQHVVYGDGTIVRPIYAPPATVLALDDEGGKIARYPDPRTGELRDTPPGRFDPDIAEYHGHRGPVLGHGYVAFHCRGPAPYGRVTLLIDHIPAPGQEAATAVSMVPDLRRAIGDGARVVVYDGALLGTHIETIMRRDGYLVIAPMGELDAGDAHAATTLVMNASGKRMPSHPLGSVNHDTAVGACRHVLVALNGHPVTVTLDDAGDPVIEAMPQRGPIKRSRRADGRYYFSVEYDIPCPHGHFSVWLTPHADADHPNRPNILRPIAYGDPAHISIGGIRSDAESVHAQFKRTLITERAMSLGWRRGLLDYYAFAIYSDAMTHWHARNHVLEPKARRGGRDHA